MSIPMQYKAYKSLPERTNMEMTRYEHKNFLAKQQSDLDKTFEAQSSSLSLDGLLGSDLSILGESKIIYLLKTDTKTKRTSTNKPIDSSKHNSNNINYLLIALEKEELSRLIKEAEERKHSRNRRIWYTNGKVTKQRDLLIGPGKICYLFKSTLLKSLVDSATAATHTSDNRRFKFCPTL
ncbi:hypothetical protein YC2023_078940 [Brassica napus]